MRKKVYSIFFTKSSKKQFQSLPQKVQNEVALILEEIARDPLIGKPLQGALKGLRAKRVGIFRIVYKQEKAQLVIIIIGIGHRKGVYRNK